MRPMLAATLLIGGLFPSTTSTTGLDRPLPPLVVPNAPDDCDVHAVAQRIARAAGLSLGFEGLAACHTETHPARLSGGWTFERSLAVEKDAAITLAGLTPRDAFNWLSQQVPGYSWREVHGVPVFRPVKTWPDPDNLLNFRADAVESGEVRLGDALDLVLRRQPGRQSSGLTGNRRFSIRFPGGTIAEALSAVAAADGARGWDVVTIEHPTAWQNDGPVWIVGFRVWHHGSGGGSAYVIDPHKLKDD